MNENGRLNGRLFLISGVCMDGKTTEKSTKYDIKIEKYGIIHSFYHKTLEALFIEIEASAWYTECGDDSMNELLEKIRKADQKEIDRLLDAVILRKRELFPNWEILYLALPKDDTQQRNAILDRVHTYLVSEQDRGQEGSSGV